MNPPPTVGLKTLIIFGLSFVKQLAHGLVKRFAGYVTLLNAFVLVGGCCRKGYLDTVRYQQAIPDPTIAMAAISNFLFRHLTFLLLFPFYNPNTINLHVLMVLSIG
jgi:hypothetical protein